MIQYMVKNPGLIPNMKSVKQGDTQKKRKMISKILEGCWLSCLEPDEDTHRPFLADAIIANPPSFAHVHCAQARGIPVHIMFTMPWTSTEVFPHPLANIKAANVDTKLANYLSYRLVN
jgi:sterol 3beta-glucosyltransferase